MEKDSLSKNSLVSGKPDYVAKIAKSVLGGVPYIGAFLSEIAGTVIPNQRTERVAMFAEILEKRMVDVETKIEQFSTDDESLIDLIEEGMISASRSLSDERREYIASIIANSINIEEIESYESKHLLNILNQLNDIEIVWLRSYLSNAMRDNDEFWKKHEHILSPVSTYIGCDEAEIEKEALQQSYKQHLASFGLLKEVIELKQKNIGTTINVKRYEITSLGRLLLKRIGIVSE